MFPPPPHPTPPLPTLHTKTESIVFHSFSPTPTTPSPLSLLSLALPPPPPHPTLRTACTCGESKLLSWTEFIVSYCTVSLHTTHTQRTRTRTLTRQTCAATPSPFLRFTLYFALLPSLPPPPTFPTMACIFYRIRQLILAGQNSVVHFKTSLPFLLRPPPHSSLPSPFPFPYDHSFLPSSPPLAYNVPLQIGQPVLDRTRCLSQCLSTTTPDPPIVA